MPRFDTRLAPTGRSSHVLAPMSSCLTNADATNDHVDVYTVCNARRV